MLTVFDDLLTDMEANRKVSPIVTKLFIRGRKINIALAFISQSHFRVSKDIKLNVSHYSIMETPSKKRTSTNNNKSFIWYWSFDHEALIYHEIKQNKVQWNLNRETSKIWFLWSRNVDKYWFLIGEGILPEKQLLEKAAISKDSDIHH